MPMATAFHGACSGAHIDPLMVVARTEVASISDGNGCALPSLIVLSESRDILTRADDMSRFCSASCRSAGATSLPNGPPLVSGRAGHFSQPPQAMKGRRSEHCFQRGSRTHPRCVAQREPAEAHWLASSSTYFLASPLM